MDRKKIIETFERIERDDGGVWSTNALMTLEKTAIELDIPKSDVRNVMIAHWTKAGGG
jgi:hypothetical protein